MDPNRHTLQTILSLPTPRLLTYYKKIRYFPSEWEDISDLSFTRREAVDQSIKEELDNLEHVGPNKKRNH